MNLPFANQPSAQPTAAATDEDDDSINLLDLLDVVIDQDPDTQAIRALQNVVAALGLSPATGMPDRPGEFRLYFAENMGQQPYLG